MKDTIKNSIIGAFAIFGMIALISSSKTAPTVIHEGSNTPESHVQELKFSQIGGGQGGSYPKEGRAYAINKVTGEVRKYSRSYPNVKGSDSRSYIITSELIK